MIEMNQAAEAPQLGLRGHIESAPTNGGMLMNQTSLTFEVLVNS